MHFWYERTSVLDFIIPRLSIQQASENVLALDVNFLCISDLKGLRPLILQFLGLAFSRHPRMFWLWWWTSWYEKKSVLFEISRLSIQHAYENVLALDVNCALLGSRAFGP